MQIEELYSRYQKIIPDFREFIGYLKKPLPLTFRLNTLKCNKEKVFGLLKDFKLNQLNFYKDGFILNERFPLGNHYTHQLGFVYIQEPASMIPVLVLDPKPNETILDLCAAPGSKTTQIAQMIENQGIIVANEVNRKRVRGLIHNVKRCGILNEVIITLPGERIGNILPAYFDRILLDAPCSAEGTIRKSKAVLYHWGIMNILKMSKIQKGLINSAFKALQCGGILVYSTCTIAPEENEGVIDYLLKKFPEADVLPINLPNFKTREGVTHWEKDNYDPRVKLCARILPQDNDTAPFFVAKITKKGIPRSRPGFHGRIEFNNRVIDLLNRRFGIPPERLNNYAVFPKNDTYFICTPEVYSFFELSPLRKGIEIGRIYGNELKPDNDFIQIFGYGAKNNFVEIKDWELKKFLKGESIRFNGNLSGFVVLLYRNLPVAIGRASSGEIKPSLSLDRRIR